MKNYLKPLVILIATAIAVTSCKSASSKFYILNSTVKVEQKSSANYSISIDQVLIPMEVNRPQFTVKVGTNRVEIDEFNRWAEPLSSNIASVIAHNLSILSGTQKVIAVPMAGFNPDYRVTVDIQNFESDPGQSSQITAIWIIRTPKGDSPIIGKTVAIESVADDSFNELAAAHSRALAKVSRDVAKAIQIEAAKTH